MAKSLFEVISRKTKSEDPPAINELASSFNKLIQRLEDTTQSLDRKIIELTAVKELYEVARKSMDIEALLIVTLEKAMTVTGARIGSLVVLEWGTNQYRLTVTKGLDKELHGDSFINLEESFLKHVISEKRPFAIEDIENDPRIRKMNDPRYGAPSFMSMPILIEDKVAAILNLANKETNEPFGEGDIKATSAMLEEIRFTLDNAHSHAKIKEHLKAIRNQNKILEQEINERTLIEEKLRRSQDELELMVEKRTAELLKANELMRIEIAERRRAEEILRESEEKYRLHFSNTSDLIYSISSTLVITDISPSIERLMGYKPDEVIGLYLSDCPFFIPEYRGVIISDLMRVMDGEAFHSRIYEFLAKDGSKKIVDVSGISLVKNGNVTGAISVARDITERKGLESELHQARKLEAIGTLASGIAHDFNNVLTGIQGHASIMLIKINESHPHYKNLKNIEEQVRSGSNLTRQLLGFARGGRIEVEPTNMNDIIRKTAEMFGRTRKDIVFRESYQDDISIVEADRGQMEQVLLNLFVNSSQAMLAGGEVRLFTRNISVSDTNGIPNAPYITPGKYIFISVADTGEGMDEKTKERIFEPFFTTKEPGKGTGLGLSTAYGIIKNHNGFISVFSEKGRGADFHIYLPVSDKKLIPKDGYTDKLYKGCETILIVDDEEEIIKVCRTMLEMLGYKVMVAISGEDAINKYRFHKGEIDMVIMDMIMPGIGGEQALRELKAMNPDLKTIIATGYGNDKNIARLTEQGSSKFLQKPFQLQTLSKTIREALDNPASFS